MTIFEKIEARATGMRGIPDLKDSPVVVFEAEPTGEISPYQLDSNEQYVLRLQLGVSFWANKAQLQEATKIAKRQLAYILYDDILGLVTQLQMEISDGNRKSAMATVSRIRDAVVG